MKNTPCTSTENLTTEAIVNIATSIARRKGVDEALDWLYGNFSEEEVKEAGYELSRRLRARKR